MSTTSLEKQSLVLPRPIKDTIKPYGVHLVLGRRHIGRTTMVFQLLDAVDEGYKDIVIAVAPVDSDKYRSVTPNVYSSISNELADKLKTYGKDNNIVVILDDLEQVSKSAGWLFMNSRHHHITVLVTAQYKLDPPARANVDVTYFYDGTSSSTSSMHAIWASHFGYYDTKEAFIQSAKNAADNNCWLCYNVGGNIGPAGIEEFHVQRSKTIPVMEPCMKLLETETETDLIRKELKNIRDELNGRISELINLRKRLDDLLV